MNSSKVISYVASLASFAVLAGCDKAPGPTMGNGGTGGETTTSSGTGGTGGGQTTTSSGTGGTGGQTTTTSAGLCGKAPTQSGAACILPANITASMTIGSECQPWHIASSGTVVGDPSSPVLTIDPCVTIEVDPGGFLAVSGSDPGGLVAVGTASQHITFTSSAATPASGDWGSITFNPGTLATSELGFIDLEYGGGNFGNNHASTIELSDSAARRYSLHDLTLSHNGAYGIYLSASTGGTVGPGFAAGSGNLTIKDWPAGLSPIFFDFADGVATVPTSLTTGASGHDGQVEVSGQQIDVSGTWPAIPIPYLVDNPLAVYGAANQAATLTILAPNTIQFKPGASLLVAQSGPGGLVAEGTSADHIKFTSAAATPAAGDWGPIGFGDQLVSTSSLGFVDLDYCGQAQGFDFVAPAAIEVGNAQAFLISLHDLTITHNLSNGIALNGRSSTGVGFAPSSRNLTINDWGTGLSPILLSSADAAATVPTSLTTGASGHDGQVEITSGAVDVTQTWPAIPIPYLLDEDLNITGVGNTTATLTLKGVTLQFPLGVGLNVDPGAANQGKLVAQNVTFTSSSATPSPGAWAGISFKVTAAGQAGSSLTNSTIEYAGSAMSAAGCAYASIAVIAWGASAVGPTITGNTVSQYPATDYGLDVDAAITNAQSYSQNTFSGGIGGVCNQ